MIFDHVHGALRLMTAGPMSLSKALTAIATVNGSTEAVSSGVLCAHLKTAAAGDATAGIFRRQLASWDNDSDSRWTEGTEKNSAARRTLIYQRLSLDPQFILLCDERFPFYEFDQPVVIAREHKEWYTAERRQAREFYWSAYVSQLSAQGWSDESINQLDESTTSVVERLADPTAREAFQSKGLVVGYVQSGKTANFTGVIAKAVDAGFKLIIVLAGMLDVLRSQTQRRIDKDLVGQELLDQDYIHDADWNFFLKHGAKPSQLGSFDIYRLTGPEADYQQLNRGVDALRFAKPEPTKPLWNPDNLFQSETRIAVLKKNSMVVTRLLADLQLLSRNTLGAPLEEVPALLIDDESDQASINPRKSPKDGAPKKRNPTNRTIVELLQLLPRAQYIGYTATPFANVFVDADDAEDIFPKDFILALPRPADYMGVSDFYDLDGSPDDEDSRPNQRDFVRPVTGEDDEDTNLPRAIDSFVLTGALKLYRESRMPELKFRHHTMLIHGSHSTTQHEQLATVVTTTFARAGYEGGRGLDRLRKLFEDDFRPVSATRAQGLPFPRNFDELLPYVGDCLTKIGRSQNAVLIVNNENPDQTPNFDREAIWKFIVGGTKLSRGYTVEGLTISYYRRRASTADTLMQMGRWFGFRKGYRDLVRLYIGTQEPVGKTKRTINLYEAFGAVCRDEEMFREELQRYSQMTEPRILPSQIPPLVPSHMLRPTARNKMYNATIAHRNFGGRLAESTFAPTEPSLIRQNQVAFERLLSAAEVNEAEISAELKDKRHYSYLAKTAVLQPRAVLEFLESYIWSGRTLKRPPLIEQIDFLKGTGKRDPEITSWLLLAPQLAEGSRQEVIAGTIFKTVGRGRRAERDDQFVTYNDPKHRQFAEHIAGQVTLPHASSVLNLLREPKRAVMLFYAVTDKSKPGNPYTPAFTLFFPKNHISSPITFAVQRLDLRDEVVVPAS